jgi:hypothetical protein
MVRLTVKSKTDPDVWVNLNGPRVMQLRHLHPIENVLAMD